MNEIHIPIEAVHLETRFQGSERVEYALLEPQGQVTPIRVRFSDLRGKLGDRFSDELTSAEVVARLANQTDLQVILKLQVQNGPITGWDINVRFITPGALDRKPAVELFEQRKSRRVTPERCTDIKVELGSATLEGTLYNVSEHGLGIALYTADQDATKVFQVDQMVELVGPERIRGRIASQYPAAGGCVLGIELKERLNSDRLCGVEA